MMRRLVSAASRAVWAASSVGMRKGDTFSRFSMYRELRKLVRPEDLGDRVLSVSHSTGLVGKLGGDPHAAVEANYPEQQIDRLSFEDDSFSAVVSDQVLEHIECTPTEAVDEVWRVLRPGGLAVHTTCFFTPYHGPSDFDDLANGDFWRFTPSGLRLLHKRYARAVAGGWGNAAVSLVSGAGCWNMPVPEASWHPLHKIATMNRPSYASVIWVIARK